MNVIQKKEEKTGYVFNYVCKYAILICAYVRMFAHIWLFALLQHMRMHACTYADMDFLIYIPINV